jgi:hypothetical protein
MCITHNIFVFKGGKNYMKNKKFFKGAVVLLLATLMIFSSVAIADTKVKNSNLEMYNTQSGGAQGSRGPVVWDNHMNYDGLITAQIDSAVPFSSEVADDFHFEEPTEVHDVHWVGAYWNGADYNLVHWPWEIKFYDDDGTGTKPGNLIGVFYFPVGSYTEILLEDTGDPATGIFYELSVDLEPSITFNPCNKYWVSFQAIGDYSPQSGVGYHFDPIKLHEGVLRSTYFGFPDWTDLSIVVPSDDKDLCFQLTGPEYVNPSIDVEKYVWDPKNQEWVDADDIASAVSIAIGKDVTFKIVIHNNGDCPLIDILVQDKMHDSLEFLATDPVADDVYYLEPYWYMTWFFPGPLDPCNIIEIYVTARVLGPDGSNDENYVLVQATSPDGQGVVDEDWCWINAKKTPISTDMPFFTWLQSHPKMFPILRQLLGLLF